ncbi:N-acetyl-gamma-glutamyl-phosphate reductase [Bacillus sp. THAF10]|uniref:N-acetyl-gamma-glutamyl-phosphate reductase n=1 Tax=Bacillus sp. THAF10 TaxID=2587848 RepID=UPI001267C08F|nr:N-acetyl-gamma-glutamyl-phosphate reductase [Bacillus sp. THAF10]QFT89163.1 N-acetyl-gamma-glutamyl-phosphate reductase [Bacillus sp. THAF10]
MKVGIIGANGYSGVELIRILSQHPQTEISFLASHSSSGKMVTEQYPHLQGIVEEKMDEMTMENLKEKADFFFFATPAGVAKEWIPVFLEAKIPVVDLSGDHRLKHAELYEKWYKYSSTPNSILAKAAYGLPEINKEQIKKSSIIANPGCYPTATLLGLAPVIKHQKIKLNSIIVDGKSGVTGAGRKATLGTHYCEVNENVKAYKLGKHQHIPEMEQVLQSLSGEMVKMTFSTHLIPMSRGLMCTIYADLKETVTSMELLDLYQDFYKNQYFVRIRKEDHFPATKEVYGSNYCDIGLKVDTRTNRLMIVSVIDNVMKGASGQAVQNMNIMKGWEEHTGLQMTPVYP